MYGNVCMTMSIWLSPLLVFYIRKGMPLIIGECWNALIWRVIGWWHQLLHLELYLLILPQPFPTHSYLRANKPSWYDKKNQWANSKERPSKCYDSDASLIFCNSVNIAKHGNCRLWVNYFIFRLWFPCSLFSTSLAPALQTWLRVQRGDFKDEVGDRREF